MRRKKALRGKRDGAPPRNKALSLVEKMARRNNWTHSISLISFRGVRATVLCNPHLLADKYALDSFIKLPEIESDSL